jgi:hypothetical protein
LIAAADVFINTRRRLVMPWRSSMDYPSSTLFGSSSRKAR